MPTWIALPGAVVGFALGWLSAWATERLEPSDEPTVIRWRSGLVRDPLVQGSLGVLWLVIPFAVGGNDPIRWLEAGVLSVPLVQVAVTDLRTRYVYTVVAVVGLVLGLAMGWHFHGGVWWGSVLGAVSAGLVFAALYGIGRLIYRGGEPMARGDITIAAMIGASAATFNCVLSALVYGVLASGILAVAVLAITRSRHVYMPYGPGLCLGGLVITLVPALC